MKHWLIIGGMIIVSVVLLMRSRIAPQPTTAPGVSVDQLPASYRPTTSPATHPAGVTLDKLPSQYVPVPTH